MLHTLVIWALAGMLASGTALAQQRAPGKVECGAPLQFCSLLTTTSDYTRAPATWPVVAMPPWGGQYTDPTWGTTAHRVAQPKECDKPPCDRLDLYPDYAKQEAWNADGSVFLLLDRNGYYHLYDSTTNKPIRRITDAPGLCCDREVRWSNRDARLIYYAAGMSLRQYDIERRAVRTVHTFSCVDAEGHRCSQISGGDEGNPSNDDRFWVFWGEWYDGARFRPVDVFVYDRETDAVVVQRSVSALCGGPCRSVPDWIGMSPSGRYVVLCWKIGNSSEKSYVRSTGIELFDRQLTYLGMVFANPTHADVGYDVNGREVAVTVSGDAMIGTQNYWTVFVRRLDTLQRSLISLPCTFGYAGDTCGTGDFIFKYSHVSLRAMQGAGRGWALISTYGADRGWGASELLAVQIDTSVDVGRVFRRIGRTFSRRGLQYYAEPHAVPNRDFTKVLWGSNWLTPGGQISAYVVALQ